MKNFKFIAAVLTVFLLGLGVYSCQKDRDINENNKENVSIINQDEISFINNFETISSLALKNLDGESFAADLTPLIACFDQPGEDEICTTPTSIVI